MSRDIDIRMECCNIWNTLKDKSQMINYLVECKKRIAELEQELEIKNEMINKIWTDLFHLNNDNDDWTKSISNYKSLAEEKVKKFCEKQTFELEKELEELKLKYKDCDEERLENRLEYLTMKNKWLNNEQELAELKEKAIVPRFKIGDTAYAIMDTLFYDDGVFKVNILGTELCYRVDRGDNDISTQHHTRLFATEQEAQEKLKEMNGND